VSRRLSILATVILLLFVVVAAQSANLQFFRASALNTSPINPRNEVSSTTVARGRIYAADGSILAESTQTAQGRNVFQRIYPYGALTSGVVGFSSPTYGNWALEDEYNQYLTPHAQPAQSFAQVLAPTTAADSITLTIYPSLQRVAQRALAGRDGAAVVIDPQNGDILAMYSNPNFDPAPLTSPDYKVALAAWTKDNKRNAHGFTPLGELAIQQTFPPGSTFKIVTTSAVVVSNPGLLTKVYPNLTQTPLPNTKLKLHNYHFESCGGTIAEMLPPSCDTGFALVGLDVGATALSNAADSYGYDEIPPIDLPSDLGGAVPSNFPPASAFTYNLPQLAYSAIGQENVRTTALQNALVAAAVAEGGKMMTPHFMNFVSGPDGTIVKRYKPHVWKTPLTPDEASQIAALMRSVVTSSLGTAYGVFPAADEVSAKTGTAEVGTASNNTDDWMIAFAPASEPTVAVAVVLPFQAPEKTGAVAAGPVISCVLQGALAVQHGEPASGTSTTCPN
jgi:peptidoglycan glycosyltransferase